MDDIVQLGCIACIVMGVEETPAEVHHVYGKTAPDAHFWTIPLCPSHHRYGLNGAVASRHPHKKRFEELYGTEIELRERVCRSLGRDPLAGPEAG
jgi:hypothetical protein